MIRNKDSTWYGLRNSQSAEAVMAEGKKPGTFLTHENITTMAERRLTHLVLSTQAVVVL